MLISNCSWASRELAVTFRQPFDILEEISLSEARVQAGNELQNGALPIWLPGPESQIAAKYLYLSDRFDGGLSLNPLMYPHLKN